MPGRTSEFDEFVKVEKALCPKKIKQWDSRLKTNGFKADCRWREKRYVYRGVDVIKCIFLSPSAIVFEPRGKASLPVRPTLFRRSVGRRGRGDPPSVNTLLRGGGVVNRLVPSEALK